MSKYNELTLVKSFILFLIWYLDHLLLSFFCNRHLTLGIGQYFSKEFPLIRNLKYTFTSTITSTDIVKSPKRLNQKRSFKLLYSGRITYDKGLRNVIIAMSILSKKGVHVEFNILGEGRKELNILWEMAHEMSIEHQLQELGYTKERHILLNIMRQSDAMIIPSLWDFQTRSIWEGMCSGLPILASYNIKSLPLEFDNEKEILFIKPNDPDDIAKKIELVAQNYSLYHTMSKSSLKIAKRKTAEISAKNLISFLKKNIN